MNLAPRPAEGQRRGPAPGKARVVGRPRRFAGGGDPEAGPPPRLPNRRPSSISAAGRAADPGRARGRALRLQFRLPRALPEKGGPWRIRLSDLDTGNILFETTFQWAGSTAPSTTIIRVRIEVWPATRGASHDYDARPGGAGPVPGRHARRHPSAGSPTPRSSSARTAAGSPAPWPSRSSRCSATPIPRSRSSPTSVDAEALLRHLQHRPVLQRRGAHPPALRFPPGRAAPHRRLHSGRRSGARSRRDRAPDADSRPIAEPYVCIAVQSTTQAKYWNNPAGWREIVRSSRTPAIGWSASTAPGPRPRPDLEPPAARRARTKPATARCRSARAGCSTRSSSSACPAAWPGSPGRPAAGGDDQRLHPSHQRIRHPVPGDQLPCLQQLLERRPACASTTRTSSGARATRHAPPVRVHPADHRRTGQGRHPAHPRLRQTEFRPRGYFNALRGAGCPGGVPRRPAIRRRRLARAIRADPFRSAVQTRSAPSNETLPGETDERAELVDSGLAALSLIAAYYRIAADPLQLRHRAGA